MTVHVLLCTDFEQEMCGKYPTRFVSPDGSDPIVSESTDGPIRTQCTHNPIWSGLTTETCIMHWWIDRWLVFDVASVN